MSDTTAPRAAASTRRRRWMVVALAGALTVAPVRGQAVQTSASPTEYELDGIRVIHQRGRPNDIVAVRLYWMGGARQLAPGDDGLELLFLRSAQAALAGPMAEAGARGMVDATPDWSVTGFVTLTDDLAGAWRVWASAVTTEVPSGLAVGPVRSELLSEARRRADSPQSLVATMAWQNLFRDHPYARDVRGTVDSLERMTLDRLRAYAAQQFVKSRMLLVVVGNVERAELAALVAETLGTMPAGSYAWTGPPPVQLRRSTWATEGRIMPTSYISGHIVGPPPGDEDYFAFEVATNLLSSRLDYVVRTQASLSYATYATFEEGAIPTAVVYASSPLPGQVFDLLLQQLEWLQGLDEVPGYVLNDYLDQFVLSEIAGDLSAGVRAESLARAELIHGDFTIADRYPALIRSVRPNDIRRVAIDYMRYLQLAFLGNLSLMEGKW